MNFNFMQKKNIIEKCFLINNILLKNFRSLKRYENGLPRPVYPEEQNKEKKVAELEPLYVNNDLLPFAFTVGPPENARKIMHSTNTLYNNYTLQFKQKKYQLYGPVNPLTYIQPLPLTQQGDLGIIATGDIETIVLKPGDSDMGPDLATVNDISPQNIKKFNKIPDKNSVLFNYMPNVKTLDNVPQETSLKQVGDVGGKVNSAQNFLSNFTQIQNIKKEMDRKKKDKEISEKDSEDETMLQMDVFAETPGDTTVDPFFKNLAATQKVDENDTSSLVPIIVSGVYGDIGTPNRNSFHFAVPTECFDNYNASNLIKESDLMICKMLDTFIDIATQPKGKEENKDYKTPLNIYFHNFARFDGFFILKAFYRNKKKFNSYLKAYKINNALRGGRADEQEIELLLVENNILLFRVGQLFFKDSYKIAFFPLKELASLFLGPDRQKTLELTENDFVYEGMANKMKDPVQRQTLIDYCINDSLLLYDAMDKIQTEFDKELGIDITTSLTAPALALQVFRRQYYGTKKRFFIKNKNTKKESIVWYMGFSTTTTIRRIRPFFTVFKEKKILCALGKNKPNEVTVDNQNEAIFLTEYRYENELRQAFYGGRTELIIPKIINKNAIKADISSTLNKKNLINSNILEVDINSLYPKAAASPLPYGPPFYEEYSTGDTVNINNLYGFVFVRWVSPANQTLLPVLPQKKNKKNLYSLGCGEGWYSTLEIQLAHKMGYKIQLTKAILYHKRPGLRKIVYDLYSFRKKFPKTNPLNPIAKMMLNSLSYGKFAIRTNLVRTIINKKNQKLPQSLKNLFTVKKINPLYGSEYEIITLVSKKKEDTTGLVAKVFKLSEESEKKQLKTESNKEARLQNHIFNSAVHVSAMVTAQSRVLMYPFLAKMHSLGLLFYTDTDSVFTSESAFQQYFKNRINVEKLGFFKVEAAHIGGIFFDQKRYKLWGSSEEKETNVSKLRVKGVPKDQRIILDDLSLESPLDLNLQKSFPGGTQLIRDKETLSILQKLKGEVSITNSGIKEYRNPVISEKEWIGTESYLFDIDGNPISYTELKKTYTNFKSNVISNLNKKQINQFLKKQYNIVINN